LLETEESDWDRVMDVSLKGAYLCARAAVRQMLSQEVVNEARGRLINISSQHGVISARGFRLWRQQSWRRLHDKADRG
jgi:NAD(P)-dependent dehydrogenase (short-subunit alcohol dehydrogenase family)